MKFVQFTYKGSWDESLHIFLYHDLFILEKSVNAILIDNYVKFELEDTCVKSYNLWVKVKPAIKH